MNNDFEEPRHQPDAAKLEPKQRKYLQGRMEGKSKAKAARDAGYSEAMARKPQRIETPAVKAAFNDLLEDFGISGELLAQRIRDGLDAIETKFFTKDGIATDSGNVVDFSERREMLMIALKLTGKLVEQHKVGLTLEDLLSESYEE